MSPVIIFDLSDNSALPQVVAEMGKLQYYTAWLSMEKTYWLPKNCVWKSDGELQKALDDLNQAITNVNTGRSTNPVSLVRCIALSTNPWLGIQGSM